MDAEYSDSALSDGFNNNNDNETLLRNKIQILHVYGKNSKIL